MSASFETPPILDHVVHEEPRNAEQGDTDSHRAWSRNLFIVPRRMAGRIVLAATLAFGGAIVEGAVAPDVAHASASSISFDNDYPYDGAKVHDLTTYDWWIDENHNGVFNSGEDYSPLGYGYRNCTDGAAYWAKEYLDTTLQGWGNAKDWDTSAKNDGYIVKNGSANTIEAGDIAQSDDGPYGHVGFVTDVAKDGMGTVSAVTIAEYNHAGDGAFTHLTYTSKDAAGQFIRGSNGRNWDHFIDLNGTTAAVANAALSDKDGDSVNDSSDHCPVLPGLASNAGCPVQHVYSGRTNGELYETYWGYGNALTTWKVASVESPITAVTNQLQNGIQHVYFGTRGGELYESYWGGGNRLTTYELADFNTPISSISSQITDDVQHVYTGTEAGAINETYWGGSNRLTSYRLAALGSPVRALSTQITPDDVQHVYSGTLDGVVRETYWGGGNARTTYQLARVGGAIISLDSAITADKTQHVFSSTNDGIVSETYWGPTNKLTTARMATLPSLVDMTTRFYKNVWHIYTAAGNGDLYETYWGGGNTLTTYRVAHIGAVPTSLSAQITYDDVQHMYSAATDGVVRETYWGGGNTITTAPLAAIGGGITDIFSKVQ